MIQYHHLFQYAIVSFYEFLTFRNLFVIQTYESFSSICISFFRNMNPSNDKDLCMPGIELLGAPTIRTYIVRTH